MWVVLGLAVKVTEMEEAWCLRLLLVAQGLVEGEEVLGFQGLGKDRGFGFKRF